MTGYFADREKELLQRVAASNEHAFREIFDLYRVQLFSFVYDFTHSAADAEEIVQETFLKIWEARETLPTVEYPRSYIYTIARNNTLNFLAKAARNERLMQQIWANMKDSANPTEDLMQAGEVKQLINEALSHLSERKQTIFRLSRDEGLKHEEIAERLGLSKSTVKNTLVETLRYIRDYLGNHSVYLAFWFWLSVANLV